MQDKTVCVDNINIKLKEYSNAGETIVFLHFGGGNLKMWEPIVPYFIDNYHLVLIDIKGHGKSSRPNSGYHIDQLASEILLVVNQLNIKKAHFIGSSLGAEIALSIAISNPTLVKTLLCEGALYNEYGQYGIFKGSAEDYKTHVNKIINEEKNRETSFFNSIDSLICDVSKINIKYNSWNKHVEAMERYGAYEYASSKFAGGMGKEQVLDYMSYYFYYRFEDYYRKISCPITMLPSQSILENKTERQSMEELSQISDNITIEKVSGWIHAYSWMINPKKGSECIFKSINR